MARKVVFASILWVGVSLGFLYAQQEQNGAFAGFGLGFGGEGAMINVGLSDRNVKAKTSQDFINYDLKVGYKSFFNEWFGLRGYLSFGYSNAKNITTSDGGNVLPLITQQDSGINIVDYYANLDLLFNIYATESYYVGLLGGMGIGGLDLYYHEQFLGNKNASGFQMNLKLGARLNIGAHGVELVAKVPFFGPRVALNVGNVGMKMDFRQDYNLSMSYIYNFGIE